MSVRVVFIFRTLRSVAKSCSSKPRGSSRLTAVDAAVPTGLLSVQLSTHTLAGVRRICRRRPGRLGSGKSLHTPARLCASSGWAPSPRPPANTEAGPGRGWGRDQRGGRGQPEKAEACCLRAAAEPGVRISTFSGAGRRETAGGKTRLPETLAFFDAKARDSAAAVCPAPGQGRPQTEPPESLRPRASAVPAAVLVAMECPHLSSSVCIAPDSAKFPNGSPSSWCCSGECGPGAGRPRTRGPGSGPGLAVEGP